MLTKHNRSGLRKANEEQPVPVGVIIPFAGTTSPGGWFLCQGQEISKTDYPALNAVCGTTYGANTDGIGGVGTSHFRLPDLRNAIPVGAGTGAGNNASGTGATSGAALTARTLGATIGANSVVLSGAQSGIASHNHAVNQSSHGHTASDSHTHNIGMGGIYVNAVGGSYAWSGGTATYNMVNTNSGWSINSSGSGISISSAAAADAVNEHSNVQPCVVMSYIIKAV